MIRLCGPGEDMDAVFSLFLVSVKSRSYVRGLLPTIVTLVDEAVSGLIIGCRLAASVRIPQAIEVTH
jgi:hypothetical protein